MTARLDGTRVHYLLGTMTAEEAAQVRPFLMPGLHPEDLPWAAVPLARSSGFWAGLADGARDLGLPERAARLYREAARRTDDPAMLRVYGYGIAKLIEAETGIAVGSDLALTPLPPGA